MSQLQTLNNTIPSTFEGLTKSQISLNVSNALDSMLDHGDALKIVETISAMETFIKELKDRKEFKEYAREELLKHNGKYVTSSGAKIEVIETGVKYDYSNDLKWQELNQKAEEAVEARKKHEDVLKRIPAGKLLVDEDTGETLIGPSKTSTSSYKVTLAK
jgi:predicted heme/steroid binding protein